MSADRPCPVCQSENTGRSVKWHKQYTDRGRLDIDYCRCYDCHAAWDEWDYVREDVIEIHDARRGDGNRIEWGELPPRQCPGCKSADVRWLYSDGPWHRAGTEILRYECQSCRLIWQEMVQEDDGKRLFRRVWRQRLK